MHCNEVWTLVVHTFENINLPLKQASVKPICHSVKEKPKTPAGQFAPHSHMAGQVLWKGHAEPPAMCENIARRVTHPQPCGICLMLKLWRGSKLISLSHKMSDDGEVSPLTPQRAC